MTYHQMKVNKLCDSPPLKDTLCLCVPRKLSYPVPDYGGWNSGEVGGWAWAETLCGLMCMVDASLNWLGFWTLSQHIGFGGKRFKVEIVYKLGIFYIPFALLGRDGGQGEPGLHRTRADARLCSWLLDCLMCMFRSWIMWDVGPASSDPGPRQQWPLVQLVVMSE